MFQYCPQKCAFCFQDNDDRTGLDTILEKPYKIATWMAKSKIDLPCRINILGGELFHSAHSNKLSVYKKFIEDIRFLSPVKDLEFNFISNLQFGYSMKYAVEELLEETGATIGTSWDFAGRVSNENFDYNLLELKNYISSITFVLTRPTIQTMLTKNKWKYFDWMIKNFKVQWDYYTPNQFSDQLMPSDKELYLALEYLIKNYPQLSQVKGLLHSGPAKTSCLSPNKVTFLPDGEVVACRYQDYKQIEFRTPIDKKCNENIILNFLEERGCLSCEYYIGCPLSCFVMADHIKYKEREEMDECFLKELFSKYKSNL